MGRSNILQKEANLIATKLMAKVEKGSKHDIADIYVDDAFVASFGIRRGKREPHGHLQTQLWMSASQLTSMASCTITRDQWIEMARLKGKIAPASSDAPADNIGANLVKKKHDRKR